jgi:GT2 family glycosyltransferase
MSKLVSIIVPTKGKCEQLVKPLCESIIKYTDLEFAEVIIVSNGSDDNTDEYVRSLGEPFRLLTFPEALGYTKATNEGIKASTGKYTVLLNNDCVLQPQSKNKWIDILIQPFMADEKMGITGPMKTFSPKAGRDFLIFFCVCTKKKILEEFDLLDEVFSPGYGEDTDFCCKIENAGYKIHQVCPTNKFAGNDTKRMIGDFPIYHEGNVTFKNWPGGEELLAKNNQILFERYGKYEPIIERARNTDGAMNDQELKWLGKEAKKRKLIIEIGSWHGRSSRAIGDNLMEGGVLYCVDTWNGSKAEAQGHGSAKMMDGDHAFYTFLQNNYYLVKAGKLIPIRMSSKNAADFFKKSGVQADMIFIDGGHTYEEVCQDIDAWKYVIAEDGIFCGHDFNGWAGVNQAVAEKIGLFYVGAETTIWHCDKKDIKKSAPCLFDCFPFNNELDLLEKRLTELWPVVDRFVICEATMTHGGKEKPLHFNDNLKRFERFLNKITYLVVEKFPEGDSWVRERHQRDYLMNGLKDCKDTDIVMVSDLDEIPSLSAIEEYKKTPVTEGDNGIRSFEMDLYYYNMHTKAVDKWREAKILPYGLLKKISPCGARYAQGVKVILNGGNHLSYFGDVEKIIKKIEDTAHQEYNTEAFKDRDRIRRAMENGTDVFGRPLQFLKV